MPQSPGPVNAGRLAGADRMIALVLGHGIAIYQPADGLSISQNRNNWVFAAVSLPSLQSSPRGPPKLMICLGFCRGLGPAKIFYLSFPMQRGNGFRA
jgi:hypothetical protein